jgi:MFS family permease
MRVWTTALLLMWSAITAVTAFVTSQWQLSATRLALGAAEAGTFAMLYAHLDSYLVQADFSLAWAIAAPGVSAVSSLVAGPLAAGFLAARPPFGLAPWQWLLVGEAVLAAAVGAVVFCVMLDSPESDSIFTDEERRCLVEAKARDSRANKEREPGAKGSQPADTQWGFLMAWKPWFLATLSFTHVLPVGAYVLFVPLIIKRLLGRSEAAAAALNAIPCAIDAACAFGYGAMLKRLPREARLWMALAPLGVAMLLAPALASTVMDGQGSMWSLVALSFIQGAMHTPMLNIDTLPTAFCREFSNTSDIYALINMARSAASYVGTVAFGALTDRYSSSVTALCIMLPSAFIPTAAMFTAWFFLNGVGGPALRFCSWRGGKRVDAVDHEVGIPLVGIKGDAVGNSPRGKREQDEL